MYVGNGQYEDAKPFLNAAVTTEAEGKAAGVTLVGSGPILRAMLHLREGEAAQARLMLEEVLHVLGQTEHLYTETFIALARCGLGEVGLVEREFAVAFDHFASARDVVEQNPHKIGVGYILIRAHLGCAKALHMLRRHEEEQTQFDAAAGLLDRRVGFDFNWVWSGSDAAAHFDFASYYAMAGRTDEALRSLEQAVECGWRDLPALDTDPSFDQATRTGLLAPLRDRLKEHERLPRYTPPT
jgi:tetratricopeptide (TPR) repeat protein